MARLLVISSRSSLAMGLSNADHEVLDTRPDELLATFADGSPPADAFVIGVDDPVEALDLVTEIRTVHEGAPVLLVAGRAAGWSALAGHRLEAVEVVPLPLTRPALLDALDRLLSAPSRLEVPPAAQSLEPSSESPYPTEVARSPEPGEPETSPSAAIEQIDESFEDHMLDSAQPATIELSPDAHAPAQDSITAEAPPNPQDASDETTATAHDAAPVTSVDASPIEPADVPDGAQLGSDVEALAVLEQFEATEAAVPSTPSPYGDVATARISLRPHGSAVLDLAELRAAVVEDAPARRSSVVPRIKPRATNPTQTPQPLAPPPAAFEDSTQETERASALVRRLLAVADTLANLREVAEIVATEAGSRTGAAAAALMVPDEAVWRVAGGVGLRPLELRCQQSAESWLVETVAHGDRGVIVEDTDIARQRLHGAPLANRQQLLAAPVPDVGGVLLVARDAEPFTERELSALASVGREASQPLLEALDARQLARALEHLRDPVE